MSSSVPADICLFPREKKLKLREKASKGSIVSHLPFRELNLLCVGLAPDLTQQIHDALQPNAVRAQRLSLELTEAQQLMSRAQVDVIFCSAEPRQARAVLKQAARECPGTPVIVVSREPEFQHWAEAMEQGAVDYCAAPFDRNELLWMIASHISCRQLAA